MKSLVACSGCDRFIYDTETTCPFCAAPRTASASRADTGGRVRSALSRAQRFALATAAATQLLAGCSTEESKIIPVYGAPWPDDGGPTGDGDGDGDGDDEDASTPED